MGILDIVYYEMKHKVLPTQMLSLSAFCQYVCVYSDSAQSHVRQCFIISQTLTVFCESNQSRKQSS